MLSEALHAMTATTPRVGPRLAARVVLLSVGTVILVGVLVVGMVYGFVALDGWLTARVGKVGALVIIGAAGLLMVALAMLLGQDAPSDEDARPAGALVGVELLEKYPFESAALALVAGVLVSNVDVESIARPLLAELTRHR